MYLLVLVDFAVARHPSVKFSRKHLLKNY